jgi:hypothetical protein
MSEDIKKMIDKVKNFKQFVNESGIDWKNEKSWDIKDTFPIEVFVEKSWTGRYYVVKAPTMKIRYETWQDLDSNHSVDISKYDYSNGEATWTSYVLDNIKKWGEENKNRIIINYSKLK